MPKKVPAPKPEKKEEPKESKEETPKFKEKKQVDVMMFLNQSI